MRLLRRLMSSIGRRGNRETYDGPTADQRFTAPLDLQRRPADGPLRMIYRISDGSYPKARFPFATKRNCLVNFLRTFAPAEDELLVIADNVGEETWGMVRGLHANAIRTNYGHGAGSWRHGAFEIALKRYRDDEAVYMVEDDYLHVPGSRRILMEGLAVADYVSLYDHPDKYGSGGPNPLVKRGGELSRVIRTGSTHWKQTNSTTMTVATTVGTLRADADIWDEYTRGRHPADFAIFIDLAIRARSLITPIPGCSTHCETLWPSPGVDWERIARETTT